MSSQSVAEFFDAMNRDYTASIERCFPRYREILCSLVDYLPRKEKQYQRILEIGCGTGNLSVLLSNEFPSANLHVLDLSGESLDVCRTRLLGHSQVQTLHRDIRQAEFPTWSFDLVSRKALAADTAPLPAASA